MQAVARADISLQRADSAPLGERVRVLRWRRHCVRQLIQPKPHAATMFGWVMLPLFVVASFSLMRFPGGVMIGQRASELSK